MEKYRSVDVDVLTSVDEVTLLYFCFVLFYSCQRRNVDVVSMS